MMRAFGFGDVTGVGFPGESAGVLPPVTQWSDSTLPTVAFGQGVSVTALQVASVYATIANDGVRIAPTLINGHVSPDGTVTPVAPPDQRRVVSSTVAAEVRGMLESVTSEQGTAPAARIPGYRVAGKTGTAMRSDGHGGYSGFVSSFVGFAPADDPQLVVSVVLDNPRTGHFGGQVAAPVFRDVMKFALQTLRIPPTGTAPKPYPLFPAKRR
jgi:cell division protein FtsI (penicillin-binding protein 3)